MRHVLGLTIKEILHKKILLLGFLVTLLFILFFAVGMHYLCSELVADESGVINRFYARAMGYSFLTLGWYISSFIVGSLAIMAGVGSISTELESGTILALASRPLRRRDIVLGKFAAYSAVTAAHAFILAWAVVTVSDAYFNLGLAPLSVLQGLAIFSLLPLVLLAPAFLGSTLLSSLANGVAMFVLFCLAIIGGMMEQIGALVSNGKLVNLGIASSLIQPADAVYRLAVFRFSGSLQSGTIAGAGAVADMGPFGVASAPSSAMLFYIVAYIAVFLIITLLVFSRKDL